MQYHLCVLVVTTVDKALSEAREALKQIGEEMEAWQAQYEVTFKKLKTKETANSTLKVRGRQFYKHENCNIIQRLMLAQMPTIHTCACVLPLVETTRDVTV